MSKLTHVNQLRRVKLAKQLKNELVPKKWEEFGQKQFEVNRSELFSILRNILFRSNSYWNNNTLADALDISPQRCSLYATGSDRQASWWSIMRLCQMLNKKIVLSPDAVRIEDDS